MQLVRAISRTHIGPHLMLVENELWAADDPIVLAHPEHFTDDLEPIVRRSVPKRGPGRPRTTATQPIIEAQ